VPSLRLDALLRGSNAVATLKRNRLERGRRLGGEQPSAQAIEVETVSLPRDKKGGR
jgi:hypothetical protein